MAKAAGSEKNGARMARESTNLGPAIAVVPAPRRINWTLQRELLNLRRRAELSGRWWRYSFYGLLIAPSVFSILLLAVRGPGEGLSGSAVVALILCAMLIGFALNFGTLLRRETRAALFHSDIAVRIAGGDFAEDPIFELTPLLWRGTLPRGRNSIDAGQQLGPVLRRIGANLDWYLAPPRRLFRLTWALRLLLAGWLALLIASYSPLAQLSWDWHGVFAWLAAGALFIVLVFARYRQQVWTEELAHHLIATLEVEA